MRKIAWVFPLLIVGVAGGVSSSSRKARDDPVKGSSSVNGSSALLTSSASAPTTTTVSNPCDVNSTSCSQGCRVENGTTSCYCWDGFAFSNRDKGKCVDVNECEGFGACSQSCTNVLGSFTCSCMSGFRVSARDNSSCELIERSPVLVFAIHSSVRARELDVDEGQGKNYSLVEGVGSPISVTYDARNNWVYWTDVMEYEETIWRSRLNGTEREPLIHTGVVLPEGIAFDWIANNFYFTDSNKSHIVVCTEDGGNCTVLVQEVMMEKPRDLALHPNMGLLFWTDWGDEPHIMKAGMDGSIPIPILRYDMKWPNGITVDLGNNRIYWTDAHTDRIESALLDGRDRRLVKSTGIKHPFGVDILGDMIYWSDWNLYEIQRSRKFNGSDQQTLVKEQYEKLNGLAVVHKANQPISRKNHCKDAGCSHICTLTPKNSFKCFCPVGMYLNRRDRRTCDVNRAWPHFVIGYNNTIKVSPMDAIGGNTFLEYSLAVPDTMSIGAVATIPFNTTIFLSDLEGKKILTFDIKTKATQTILDSDVGYVKGLDYDEIGDNLYWADSSHKTLNVMSMRTRTRIVLFREVDRPMDLLVAPDLRKMFLLQITERRNGKVVSMDMDGYGRRVLFRKSMSEPMCLTYNIQLKRLYWTDVLSDTIESIGVDGTSPYRAVVRAGAPFGIASTKTLVYWTDRNTQFLRGRDLITYQDERRVFIGNYTAKKKGELPDYSSHHFQLAKVAVMNKVTGYDADLLLSHECSAQKTKCSHVCLLSAQETKGTCACPPDMKLDTDKSTCVPLRSGEDTTPALCTKGRCRTAPTTKRPPSSSEKSKSSKSKGSSSSSSTSSTTPSTEPDYVIDDTFSWSESNDDWEPKPKKSSSKGKSKSKPSSAEKETSRRVWNSVEYDEYEDSPRSDARLLSNGKFSDEPVVQKESDEEKNVVQEANHPLAIVLGVIILLLLVGIVVGVVLHRRNVHPKVLVRPYVQQWVKYVNQPVQRFFDHGKGSEQMDGGVKHGKQQNHHIYEEVYHNPLATDHTYSRGYENVDHVHDLQDHSVNVYDEPTGDSHRISYSPTEKLIP